MTSNLSRRQFIKRGAAGAGAATAALTAPGLLGSCAGPARKPNVILIYTDDQAFNTIAAFGGKVLTPHIDRICREGVMFDRNYVSTPMCTPSRYTALTGEWAGRCTHERYLNKHPKGTMGKPVNNRIELRDEQNTIAKVLRDNGYATGMVGKWHVGDWLYGWKVDGKWTYPETWEKFGLKTYPKDGDASDPETIAAMQHNHKIFCEQMKRYGFDQADNMYWGNLLELQQDTLRKSHNMEWITQGATEFLDRNKDNPFFLYFSTTLHHIPDPWLSLGEDSNPLSSGEGQLEKPVAGVQPDRTTFKKRLADANVDEQMAYCTWLDDAVGALLKKLDDNNLTEDTAIIFMGDNGSFGKSSLYEIGANTPAMVWWPGKIKGGQRCNELIGNIDVTPTILDICGLEKPADMTCDGVSLLPLVQGKKTEWRDSVYLEYGFSRAVVTKGWKYIAVRFPTEYWEQYQKGELPENNWLRLGNNKHLERLMAKRNKNYYVADQLYNLNTEKQDPTFDTLNEQDNLADDPKYADKLKEMQGKLAVYLKQFPERPFAEFTETKPKG